MIIYLFAISAAELGGQLGGVRRRNGGEPAVLREEEREHPQQQEVFGARDLRIQWQRRVQKLRQQKRDALSGGRVVRAAVLRGVRQQEEEGGGDQEEGGGRRRSCPRSRRLPPHRAARDRHVGGHGLRHLA